MNQPMQDPGPEPNGSHHALNFTDRQNSWIAASITLVAAVVAAAVLWWLLGALSVFFNRVSHVLWPVAGAIVLTMICRPLYERCCRILGSSHTLGVTATILVVFVPMALFLWLFGALAVTQILRLLGQLPALHDQLQELTLGKLPALEQYLEDRGLTFLFERFNPEYWLEEFLREIGGRAYSVGSRALALLGSLLGWIVLPIYTAFFLATRPLDGSDIRKLLVFAAPKTRDNAAFLVDQFLAIVVLFFRGQVLVAVIQGVLFAIGFHVVGLEYGLILGFGLGLLNVVPYLGNAIGLSVTVPMALFGEGGSPGRLAWVIGVFAAVQTLESYVITPRVMGNRTGLSAFVVIFSLLFWNAVIGGVLGLLLAIPLSAFLVVFWRLLKREYFPPEPPPPDSVQPPPDPAAPSP